MTETFFRTSKYQANHSTFGGELSSFDFDGHHTMTTMAKKIMKDYAFDRQCGKNIKTIRQYKEAK